MVPQDGVTAKRKTRRDLECGSVESVTLRMKMILWSALTVELTNMKTTTLLVIMNKIWSDEDAYNCKRI